MTMHSKYNLAAVIAIVITSGKTFAQAFVTVYPNTDPDKALTPQQHIYVTNALTALNALPEDGKPLRVVPAKYFYQ